MAITYPRPLPSDRLTNCTFDLLDGTVSSASHRGTRINVTRTSDPTWKASIASTPLNYLQRVEMAKWSAWKKSMQGGLKHFTAWDINRPTPLAYPNANQPSDIGSGWNGDATVTNVGGSGALSLSDLPSTYNVATGDRVGLKQTVSGVTYYGYFEVIEDVVAAAGIATLTLVPFIPSVFTTSATATLWRPVCRFVIDWQSWTESGSTDLKPFTFEAYQRL